MRPSAILLLAALAACAEGRKPLPAGPAPVGAGTAAASVPEVPAAPVDFAAYGDCRSDHSVHGRICASILRLKPKFVLVSGDLVDWGRDEEDWEIFRKVTGELRSKVTYLPAKGNHDLSLERNFEKEFGLDRSFYERRIGDVHAFLLDSNDYFSDPYQIAWLEEKVKESTARHKFAVFHHPPYSLDSYGEFEGKPIRERLHAVLLRLKFCAVFTGHHHVFTAMRRDGLRYVVTAGGGAPLYDIDERLAQPGDLYRRFHHFVGCRFTEKGISAHVFDPDGREVPELAFPLCEH